MSLKTTLGILQAGTVLSAGCIDRKHLEDASVPGEAGPGPDTPPVAPIDGPAVGFEVPIDSTPGRLDIGAAIEAGVDLPAAPDARVDAMVDLPRDLEGLPEGPTDLPPPPSDLISDLGPDNPQLPDASRDVPADLAVVPDLPTDLPWGPEASPDVPPTACVIAGIPYADGAHNPVNSCQVCKAALPSNWSNVDEGTPCSLGYCNLGTCEAGCFIQGAFYAPNAPNPSNACQTCQTSVPTSWTALPPGSTCGAGMVCSGGSCQSGCWIDGALIGSGTTNSSNVCQICRPTATTSGWSNNADGTSCGAGRLCTSGQCQCPSSAPTLCDTCVNTQTDPNNCGGCNVPCGANRTCSNGACQCLGPKFQCGTCASWDFESNHLEGWTGTDPYGGGVFGSPTVVATPGSPSFGGKYSLAFASSYGEQPAVFVNLCGSGGTTTDVSGFSISMYFDGPAYPGGIDLVKLHDTAGADLTGTLISPPAPDTWFTVSSTFSTVSAQYLEIDVIPTSGPWSGTVYIDNVQFTP